MTKLMLLLARLFSRTRSDKARFALALRLSTILAPGMRHHWRELDWLSDDAFNRYLDHFGERDGLNSHRRWMLWQLLRLAEAIPGDTAECGVFEGASSFVICQWAARQGRTHFAIDSYAGLSTPGSQDGNHWRTGDLSASEALVRSRLAPFQHVQIIAGWIPEVLAKIPERRFSFVHIDVDLFEPTLASIRHFYGRMHPGGVILCDDYGFSTCPGATAAIDGFLADKPERMIALPNGGAFMIKGTPTTASASVVQPPVA